MTNSNTLAKLDPNQNRHDLHLIQYAIEDQLVEVRSGYISLNRYPYAVVIRYWDKRPSNLHRKTRLYHYDKNDSAQPLVLARHYREHIPPLVPIVISGHHGAKCVVMRVLENTNQDAFERARKKQFDLARSISPYWP